jgi:branched-chain amino acid transport system permease protein
MIDFMLLLAIYIGIYVILALGLNLIAGYTGLLSLCQAAFFGIGAYTTAILMTAAGFNFWLAAGASGCITSLFGFLIGLPTLRLKGDYLAIATLGFGEIVKNVILNWDSLTRGPMGINGVPAPKLAGLLIHPDNKLLFTVFIWIFVVLTYLALGRIVRSRFGRALEAIREDEIAASSMGISVTKYKITAFVIGSFAAGIAGSLWAVYNQSVAPQTFDFMLSILLLCMVVLGGLGNNPGALLGALILVIVSELPRLLGFSSVIPPQANQILFGVLLVVMMIYRPDGILGRKKTDFEKLMKKIVYKNETTDAHR